ncbi:uncharacterized protein ACBR49_006762 [Aulostomus maculatus]
MDDSESTIRERTRGHVGNQEANNMLLMNSKPLHRFVQKEPRSIGIAIVVLGCAELLMGFVLATETLTTSSEIYIPFWQGALFLVCGNLSIYTEMHPSKRMVTVCLAMYVVTILGIIVSVCFRISYLTSFSILWFLTDSDDIWAQNRREQLSGIEGLLLTSSLCVSLLLIFLSTFARLALKSTHTQVIVQCVPPPSTETTTGAN